MSSKKDAVQLVRDLRRYFAAEGLDYQVIQRSNHWHVVTPNGNSLVAFGLTPSDHRFPSKHDHPAAPPGNRPARLALKGRFTVARTNLDRAQNGRDIAASALNDSHHLALEDYETGLVDALANLLHFARRYSIDFDAALASARDHHATEAIYPWDAVPGESHLLEGTSILDLPPFTCS